MIENAKNIPTGSVIKVDLCIAGGGSAAISVALEYLKSGKTVAMLPGGGKRQTPGAIDLYRGKVSPSNSHEPLEENRLRMWGGTTTVWGGRCVPFDKIDFQERDWIPESGWPVTHEELLPYIAKANELSEAGQADFDARSVFPETPSEMLPGFDNEDLVTWPLERWSIPTDYAKRYASEMESAKNLRVLMNAHLIHIQMDQSGEQVESITAACSPENTFTVIAENYVLACGALETARLLLASRDVVPEGIGNRNDLVGRYYQSHRFGACGSVVINDLGDSFIYDFERDHEGVYCRRRFWLTEKAQAKFKTCNVIGFLARPVQGAGHSEHRNALVSLVLLIKIFIGGAKKGPKRLVGIVKSQRKDIINHLEIILRDFPSLIRQAGAIAYTRFFQKRRLPMVLPPKKTNRFSLFFQTEHAPRYESRVVLDLDSKDEFGMPRLDAQIRFSDVDYHSVRTFVKSVQDRLKEQNIGTLYLSKEEEDYLKDQEIKPFNSNSHNIGTTRMAQTPDKGVVDTDCKVFGVENLYIASSSIFPTSSHANPTLMIVAFALRLGEHLAKVSARSETDSRS